MLQADGDVTGSFPRIDDRNGTSRAIIARDVVVRYGEILALDHFSVEVPKGITGLLGPNGAGKSTFIKTVLGLVEPQGGEVIVSGFDARLDTMIVRDSIGYMPEHDCLIDSMSGVDLVSYMGRLSGMSKQDAIPRSHEMLDFVGIGEERYRPIGSYSTGMKQRVKLAQAIVHDPGILFLDEPTNGMDPLGREEMLALIDKIAASDKSVLVSSHILQDIENVCDDVVIIAAGKAVAQGKIDSLLSQGKDRKRMIVRGSSEELRSFLARLGKEKEIVSTTEEFGQVTVVLMNQGTSGAIFDLAAEERVQVRAYLPDKMSLEDYFIKAVAEVQ